MVLPFVALLFAGGALIFQLLPGLPAALWLLLILPCAAALKLPRLGYIAVLLLGFLWALLQGQWYSFNRLPDTRTSQEQVIQGRIVGLVKSGQLSQRFEFEPDPSLSGILQKNPRRIRLSWYRSQHSLKGGQRWRLKVRLKPIHGFRNPGGFDYEGWAYLQGIQAVGYVRRDEANRRLPDRPSISSWRQQLLDGIRTSQRPFNGVLAALLLGEKSLISQSQWQVFRRTGTSHLMAISGLHIGLVAGLVFFLVRRFCPLLLIRYMTAQQWAALMSLLAALLYALLAGFSIPTQRALIMLMVLMGAILLKRSLQGLQALSVALLAVVIWQPEGLLSAGFYLSFMAVLAIAYGFYGRPGRMPKIIQLLQMQWRLGLLLLPLSLFWFQQASLIAPVANLLMVPWVSLLVVPVALLSLLFNGWLPGISALLLDGADYLLALCWPMLSFFSELPLAVWPMASPSVWMLLLALAGLGLLLAPRGLPLRGLGLLCVLPLLFAHPYKPEAGSFRMVLLDVGQGLAVFIQTRHHTMVFDTGPAYGEDFNAGERVILPFLRQQGVDKLDLLLISHGDRDHMGGAAPLLARFPVGRLQGQGIESLDHPLKQACQGGQQWSWDGVSFAVLHPDKAYRKSNNRACVLKIGTAGSQLLIASDIEKKVEYHLLEDKREMLAADVLLVPHHGSKSSSAEAFIQAVSPELALVSAGFANRFGHPHKAVMKRYEQMHIPVYNTADTGAIELIFHQQGFDIARLERQSAPHIWSHR